jgi:sialate O-acetylesterase
VRRITTFLCLACSIFSLRAEVKLAPIFGDHMVIQQGVTLPVWGTASPGETVIVNCAGREARTQANDSGAWRVILRPIAFTGESCELIVNGSNRIEIHDVLPGDVWIAAGEGEMAAPLDGTSIGKRAGSISDPGARFYVREASGKGHWVVVSPETSPSLPAVSFFFARDLRASRKTPIGMIDCTTTSPAPINSWISTAGLEGLGPLNRRGAATGDAPSYLFKTLIKPLAPFAISGVIWDQGVSDEGDHALRHRLFLSHLIRDWRRTWEQGPFPILMLLPPGKGSPDNSAVEPYLGDHGTPRRAWPWIREGIFMALRLPNTGIASATDLGGEDDRFDPLVAGRRLALTARHLAYGEEIAFTGPVFRGARIEQSRVRLYFEGAKGGLTLGSAPGSGEGSCFAVSSSLKGFALRGKEGRWFPAEARIDGETVLISSDAVPKPVAARYNWKSLPDGNLYDKAGLPAPPFRTDSDQPK